MRCSMLDDIITLHGNFSCYPHPNGVAAVINLDDDEHAKVLVQPNLIDSGLADTLTSQLACENIEWHRAEVVYAGVVYSKPFYVCEYSVLAMQSHQCTNHTINLIHSLAKKYPTSLLVQKIDDGQDNISWQTLHSGMKSVLLIGATRKLSLRHKYNHYLKIDFMLQQGDLLIFVGKFEELWEISIPVQRNTNSRTFLLNFSY